MGANGLELVILDEFLRLRLGNSLDSAPYTNYNNYKSIIIINKNYYVTIKYQIHEMEL